MKNSQFFKNSGKGLSVFDTMDQEARKCANLRQDLAKERAEEEADRKAHDRAKQSDRGRYMK